MSSAAATAGWVGDWLSPDLLGVLQPGDPTDDDQAVLAFGGRQVADVVVRVSYSP